MAGVIRKLINSGKAPKAVAPYNQAVLADRTLYVSGVLGLSKDTMKLVEGGARAEARQALVNLGHILQEAGLRYDNVVKTTLLFGSLSDYDAVNEIYKEFFSKNYPARTAFQVAKLPMNASVEIEAVAIVGDVTTIPSAHL